MNTRLLGVSKVKDSFIDPQESESRESIVESRIESRDTVICLRKTNGGQRQAMRLTGSSDGLNPSLNLIGPPRLCSPYSKVLPLEICRPFLRESTCSQGLRGGLRGEQGLVRAGPCHACHTRPFRSFVLFPPPQPSLLPTYTTEVY
jgi:hypothetical protein